MFEIHIALLLAESQFVFNYSTIYAGSTCMYVYVYTSFILVLSYHRPAKPVWIEELDDQVRCANWITLKGGHSIIRLCDHV